MSFTLTRAKLEVKTSWGISDSDITPQTGDLTLSDTISTGSLTDGTGTGSATLTHKKTGQLAASGTYTLDTQSITTDFGESTAFSNLKGIVIENESSVASIVIGGAGTNPFATIFADTSDKIVLNPGSWVAFCTSNTVAAGYLANATNANILLTNNDGSNTANYNIYLIGEE